MSITQARGTTSLVDTIDPVDRVFGVGGRFKLNVAVHGLSSGALHDDVYRAALVRRDELRLSANKLHDLLLGYGVWNLRCS